MVDGQKTTAVDYSSYDEIIYTFALVFSPDSKHFTYRGETPDKYLLVSDGIEIKYIQSGTPTYSPDSKHFAFIVYDYEEDKCFVVLDGKEGVHFDRVMCPTFSPDSQHLAYYAQSGDKWTVVVDGVEGEEYSMSDTEMNDLGYQVISPIIFDSANSFRYIAQDGNKVYLIQHPIAE